MWIADAKADVAKSTRADHGLGRCFRIRSPSNEKTVHALEDGYTKNERLKRTPLPRQTLAYLREAYESRVSDEFVFPGRNLAKPISNMTMLKHLKEITEDETLTVHGFRTTFRTWAQKETDFEEEIIEHCLHHITGDDAEKAYKRGDRKKRDADEGCLRVRAVHLGGISPLGPFGLIGQVFQE